VVNALSCLAIFTALLLTLALRRFPWSIYIDPIGALLFIGYATVTFFPGLSSGISKLLDKTLDEDLQLRIDRQMAKTHDGYKGFHGVRSRRSGGRIFIEIALSFKPDKAMAEAMETVFGKALKKRFSEARCE
jgi:ferrous-iron efflux pump FieF